MTQTTISNAAAVALLLTKVGYLRFVKVDGALFSFHGFWLKG